MSSLLRLAVLTATLLAAIAAAWVAADWYRAVDPGRLAAATFVGRDRCAACHAQETAAYAGSDHDRAMETADESTVLGDFDDAVFRRFGQETRFFRDGEKFMVSAQGPDGQPHDYQVKYTFGVDPLQQYMVEFPGGRLQVLRESWNVDKQEWFFVAPPDAGDETLQPNDPLHWTGLAQNWNTMCAECHSTDFRKNFDLAENAYHSSYKEIDVSCEACHGPGSLHVELAESRSLFWDRRVGYGMVNRLKGASSREQLETCAPCHSRRSMIDADFHAGDAYLNHFAPQLLRSGLYHADGQIEDEVYVYGSFAQSKMYAKGVACTDCHDPHRGDVKFPDNRLCGQCHQPGKYDGAGHHHHPQAAAGAPETRCVTCHMPTTTYMAIDARHDHSLKIPRPDLTVELGTPNACNACHVKPSEDAAWAARAVREWFGPQRPDAPPYPEAFAAAENLDPGALPLLAQVLERKDLPDIVRATAVELLQGVAGTESARLRREALEHDSPLIRAAAVRSLGELTAAQLLQEAAPLLADSIRSVRMAAANRLVASAGELARAGFREQLDQAIAEYRAAQAIHLDRAASHLNLARLASELGDPAAAIESLRTAIRIEPYLTGPRGELASQLAQRIGSEDEVRQLRTEEAELLARDAKLLPNDPLPHYRRGMLLYLLDRGDEARDELMAAVAINPNDYQSLLGLALLCEQQRRWEEALAVLKHMSELRPEAEDWKGIYARIRETRKGEENPNSE